MKLWTLFFILVLSNTGECFPELVLHQYSSCTTCHVSPSGGGVLTSYGHSLAKELLSLKTKEPQNSDKAPTEEANEFLYNFDLRILQQYLNNEYQKSTRIIPMQIQGGAALNPESWALVANVKFSAKESEDALNFLSNSYGLYRIGENWNIRAGYFLPTYGINNSLHFLSTRGALGFGFDDQRPTIEFSYLSESVSLFLSAMGTRGPSQLGSSAQSIQVQWGPNEKTRFGFNYFKESNQRQLLGLWMIAPIWNSLYVIGDYSNQVQLKNQTGHFSTFKLGYEITQGINVYWLHDQSQEFENTSATFQQKSGLGFQIFPKENYNFEFVSLKEKNKLYLTKEGDYAFVLLHYYL